MCQTYQPMKLVPNNPGASSSDIEPIIFYQPYAPNSNEMTSSSKKHSPRERSSQTLTTISGFDILTTPTVTPPTTSTVTDIDQSGPSTQTSYQSLLMTTAPPLAVAPNQRIVLPASAAEQNLPFTKENYGKEKDKWILKRHICQYCGKRCLKPSDLTRHVKIHTGEYSYECSVCNKKFREKFNLNAHLRKGNCY